MLEEKKDVEETTEDENLEPNKVDTEQEVDLSDENQENNESKEESDDEGIDYKSKLEELEGEIAQRNMRIAKQDKKILKLKQRSKSDEADDDEDDEEVKEVEDIDNIVAKKVQEQMSNFVEDTIDDEINKVSTNEDEKKLIRYYFNNRIVKAGWSKKEIVEYVSDAKVLANRGKVLAQTKILQKKIESDKTASKPSSTGTPPIKSSLKITDYDKKMAEKFFKGDIKKWIKYKNN